MQFHLELIQGGDEWENCVVKQAVASSEIIFLITCTLSLCGTLVNKMSIAVIVRKVFCDRFWMILNSVKKSS